MQFVHNGYACHVVFMHYHDGDGSWFCGYVQLPANHAWFNATYDEIGRAITPYFEGMIQPDLSWMQHGEVGFDTHHSGQESLTICDVANMTRQLATVLREHENVPMVADEYEAENDVSDYESDYDPADE